MLNVNFVFVSVFIVYFIFMLNMFVYLCMHQPPRQIHCKCTVTYGNKPDSDSEMTTSGKNINKKKINMPFIFLSTQMPFCAF